ncbi:uncharacterized protein [Cherax quadricarinatus]|uniref:uncharacterized protein isoform X2 n=1 Tax=Cherax quadricarinatus TaxID=27406 RepID=UPI00387EE47F
MLEDDEQGGSQGEAKEKSQELSPNQAVVDDCAEEQQQQQADELATPAEWQEEESDELATRVEQQEENSDELKASADEQEEKAVELATSVEQEEEANELATPVEQQEEEEEEEEEVDELTPPVEQQEEEKADKLTPRVEQQEEAKEEEEEEVDDELATATVQQEEEADESNTLTEQQEEEADKLVTPTEQEDQACESDTWTSTVEVKETPVELSTQEDQEDTAEIKGKTQDNQDSGNISASNGVLQDVIMAEQTVEEGTTCVEEMVNNQQEIHADALQHVESLELEHSEVIEEGETGLNAQEEGTTPIHQGELKEFDSCNTDALLGSTELGVNMGKQENKIIYEEEESESLAKENGILNDGENGRIEEDEESRIHSGSDITPIQEDEAEAMNVDETAPGELQCAPDKLGDPTLDHEEEQEMQDDGEISDSDELIDVESLDVDETDGGTFVQQEDVEDSEQAEREEPPHHEESMEVDVPEAEGGQEDDVEGDDVNGNAGTEDEDELNDEEELNPEDIINGSLSDGKSLPQCRLKRNYCCVHCGINTQNPREHLYHLRDEHGERMKVFECPQCIYASKNQQKLIRHARMVHKLKIKRKQSSSPYKRRSKSPRAKVSPVKSTRASVSPGRSTRSSPGKSPRSSECAFDAWDGMEEEEDSQVDLNESPVKSDDKKLHYCEHCDYSCKSRKLLNRHETSYHLKRRFFRCVKCNYVTHLKGRYTKHMKYHQLPILKCDYCDFRTPYRWNLDRHLKNHTEDCGEHKCHLCNFTAQIKQSLTVHISNHHLTAEQIREREMRRTIGISDPADCTSDDQEMELLRLERDEHPDALMLPGCDPPDSPSMLDGSQSHHNGNNSFRVSNIDMGNQDDLHPNAEDSKDEDGEPKRKKPKIKITLKKMKTKTPKVKDTFFQELNERHNFEEDFIHPDDVVHRHGNVYIKTFKCHYCTFKAAFKNEVARHEKKIHSIPLPKYEVHTKKAKKSVKTSKRSRAASSDDVLSQILQFPEPDYKNISAELKNVDIAKIHVAEDNGSEIKKDEAPEKKITIQERESRSASREASVEPPEDQSSDSKESPSSKDSSKKKGLSFFEKLQERMPTSNVQNLVCQFCGHESKCLSESVRHQKLHLSAKNIYASASLSTRCQFCRHRCKTTDDLVNHLKLCPEARKNQITDSGRRPSGGRLDENEDSHSSGKADTPADDNDDVDFKDDNIDSANKLNNSAPTKNNDDEEEDDKHPMENRVFVWNHFKLQEGGQSTEVSKDSTPSNESKEKVKKKASTDVSKKVSGRSSGTKSPALYDGPLDYIESPTPQGRHYYSKRVYRCPQCSFWATTASRFHVHIVGHFNRKPYNCSECGYKSNWRWDITKHIKLKTSRDSSHQEAQVIITDETGEKNYEKYDCYLAIIQLDETNAHRTEGGIPTRKGRPKRTPEKEEGQEPTTPSASPVRKPPMVTIPVTPRLQGLPRLTRAPGHSSTSHPGPMPFGPILPGAKMMVQLAGSGASKSPSTRPPPPLSLRGGPKSSGTSPASCASSKSNSTGDSGAGSPVTSGQYQIITPQGAVNTSLETLQLLASGSTNLSKLKKQQKGSIVEPDNKESQATLSHQMRLLVWLNLLAGGADEQVSVSSTGEDGREVAKMVLDHEGNPEWKCNSCDFRDSERETIVQHIRLAHARNGPVSLLHAVHRCDVCGYAAGTKRAVQLHIDTSHSGQGGITSRCEGQNPDSKDIAGENESTEYHENARTFQCRLCPFTCKKRNEMRPHLIYHTPRPDCIFKCMFCPYYVPTKGELFEHLSIHGMEVPSSVLDAAKNGSGSSSTSSSTDEVGARQFMCGACPFETRSRAKLMHHRQFHKPKGLPFHCPHCSYNVTRRHLLSQHIRVHGMEDNLDGTGASDITQLDDRSNSPSPSLTITPVGSATTGGDSGNDSTFTDTSLLPKLTDETTLLMDDIPLVWVSRDNRFFKMFKCRHCPHVNLRKTNIQEHEKMHKTDASKVLGSLHCQNCSYVSVNAGVMSAHLKVHCGSMGQCHAVVDPSLSDEDQLRQLTLRATMCSDRVQSLPVVEERLRKPDEKVLYYCQQCPARFFLLKEIQIHSRFHTTGLPHTCDHCNYGVQQPAHLLAHLKVHTPEYQHRTRTMMSQHRTASTHPPVPGLTLPLDLSMDVAEDSQSVQTSVRAGGQELSASAQPSTIVPPQPPPTSKYMCDQCPASFSKLLTLQYHQSLHGAKNPHQCHRCSYAGKTCESLQQHLHLHTQYDENCQAEKDAKEATTCTIKKTENQKATESVSKSKNNLKSSEKNVSSYHPPIKLKLIGLRPGASECGSDGCRPQFKYYVEEQVPLSGVDLLRRKTQLEKEGHDKVAVDVGPSKGNSISKAKIPKDKEELEDDDPKRIGDPKLHYPLHIDKVTGKSREKRYKCNKCPSAFEKTEQYHVHSNLHGSNHKYKCRICDYSVKFYANFMMHINRHKYHEKMVSQNDGSPPPVDTDLKYEPVISSGDNSSQSDKGMKNRMEDLANKENLDDADLTTTERQHLLLQNKKGVIDPSKKDDDKDRRVYYCQYCPYASLRRDAVDSHSLRHHANGGYGVYKCTFCDYTASQPNFIREHIKVHFRPFKYVHPEGYMRHDRQEILSLPILPPAGRGNNVPVSSNEESLQSSREKHLIFSHETGVFKPHFTNSEDEDSVDSQLVSGIQVNFRSGDIVDAPNDFVISLRPNKGKGQFSADTNDTFEPSDQVAANSSQEVTAKNCDNEEAESAVSQPSQDNLNNIAAENCDNKIKESIGSLSFQDNLGNVSVERGKLDCMAGDDTQNLKEMDVPPLESSDSISKMEIDSCNNTESLQNAVLSISNGHIDGETQNITTQENSMEAEVKEGDINTNDLMKDESLQLVSKSWSSDQPEKFVESL